MILRGFLPELFYKIGVLKDFGIFPRKHLYCGLIFNKIAGEAYNFYKRDCIIANFAKLLKALVLSCEGLLLDFAHVSHFATTHTEAKFKT